MKRAFLFAALPLAALACGASSCSSTALTADLQTVPGQLFCALDTSGGGQLIASVIDAQAAKAGSTAGSAAVLVTGLTQAQVQADCAAAAAATGATAAVPVSPPPASSIANATQVAIVPPASGH